MKKKPGKKKKNSVLNGQSLSQSLKDRWLPENNTRPQVFRNEKDKARNDRHSWKREEW